eukprot:m.158411 g.158411  ORF g.158411 m.158411 type:complete len:65 (+) comp38736_c0_seq8:1688-1882(+)
MNSCLRLSDSSQSLGRTKVYIIHNAVEITLLRFYIGILVVFFLKKESGTLLIGGGPTDLKATLT